MKECPICHTENPSKATHCMKCGTMIVGVEDLSEEEKLRIKLIEAEKKISRLETALDNQIKLYEDAKKRIEKLEQNVVSPKEVVRPDNSPKKKKESGSSSGRIAFVDLGLPSGLLWATCNVGSTAPEDYGDCFAWGETTVKSYYSDKNYMYLDNPDILPTSADVAAKNYGGSWRMPTNEDFSELINNCKWIWVDNICGYKVFGPNLNYLFLPGTDIGAGIWGFYWSSSRNAENASLAVCLKFDSHSINVVGEWRMIGMAVRPVCTSRYNMLCINQNI